MISISIISILIFILVGELLSGKLLIRRNRRFYQASHDSSLWSEGALIGKAGSVFTSSATQHGGQESTILNFHTTLLHHGMIIVGVPYSETRQNTLSEITADSPYGASTIAGSGPDTRLPSENELAIARFQGRHVAEITKRLVGDVKGKKVGNSI
jgi:NAD(P)H:quinone oxidoreductase type IV